VEHLMDGLRVYLRTPMPYLVADRIGPIGADGLPEPAPYTTNRLEDGKPVHYLDPSALRSDPGGSVASRLKDSSLPLAANRSMPLSSASAHIPSARNRRSRH
jgi:hypothetical protein